MRIETDKGRGQPSAFETRDFYTRLLPALRRLQADRPARRGRRVFVFQDRPERRDDVIAFYGEGGSVRPLAFASAIKDMRALLHNA